MSPLIALLLLWLVPVAAFLFARRRAPAYLWRVTGFCFGAVVSPAATGLYGLYFVGPIAALLGLIGLPLAMLHGPPGYNLAIALGLVPPRTVVQGFQHVYIELLNAVVWSVVYGLLGAAIDFIRRRRVRNVRPVTAA